MDKQRVKRIGYKLQPPSFLVEYISEQGQRRRRTTAVDISLAKHNLQETLRDVRRANNGVLAPVSDEQIMQLLKRLVWDSLKGEASTAGQEADKSEAVPADVVDKDLNKLETEELEQVKAKMNKTFEANRKDKDDPEFAYDVRVEFQPAEDAGWDSDSESDDGW